MLNIKRVIGAMPRKHEPEEPAPLTTPWTESVRQAADGGIPPLAEHPHPQFRRDSYQTLNGWWDFTIVTLQDMSAAQASWPSSKPPSVPSFDSRILVPFSPEAPLSGVGRQVMPQDLAWYRCFFDAPEMDAGDECLLHFEAVDYACAVFLNGTFLGTHTGGYLPFSFSVGKLLQPRDNELLVRIWDPSDAGTQLRGKQKLERGGIWYTAQSGIWQSVWLEVLPADHLVSMRMETWVLLRLLHLEMEIAGDGSQTLEVQILDTEGQVVAHKSDKSSGGAGSKDDTPGSGAGARDDGSAGTPSNHRKMDIFLPEVHPWSSDDPYLYDLVITYGKDQVHSYCGFRTVATRPGDDGRSRFQLNNEPLLLEGVLDQGYWPDGLMTAPCDEALVFDIQAMKDAGFNMLRKHMKVEADRWYYHCDRLGMLVWQDMVSGGSPLKDWPSSFRPTLFKRSWSDYDDSRSDHIEQLSADDARYRAEWTKAALNTVSYLGNHPSIVTWVLFNEGWGQFCARDVTAMVHNEDPTRPIDAVSGWYDQGVGDYQSVHNYFRPLEVYRDPFEQKGDLEPQQAAQRAFVLSEFGGLVYKVVGHSSFTHTYGYAVYPDLISWCKALQQQLDRARGLQDQGLSGYVYTQLSDVEEETNGLLTYDRRANKLGAGLDAEAEDEPETKTGETDDD